MEGKRFAYFYYMKMNKERKQIQLNDNSTTQALSHALNEAMKERGSEMATGAHTVPKRRKPKKKQSQHCCSSRRRCQYIGFQ
jgi:hypothetical protein